MRSVTLTLYMTILGVFSVYGFSEETSRMKRSPTMVSMTAIAGSGALPTGDDHHQDGGGIYMEGRSSKGLPQSDSAEDEDESGFVLFNPKGRKSGGNLFFPITFGGLNGGSARHAEGAVSGFAEGSTAIANSFSTGKSGMANSHATSFGENSGTALFRSRRSPQDQELNPANTFFPVNFNNYGYSASPQSAGGSGYPLNSRAISNSFATGASGSANSHSTAFGTSPYGRAKRFAQYDEYQSEPEVRSREGRANSYFPITFNSYGDAASGRSTGGAGFGSSTTAIANSFATGRSGVANSHATSFGDPSAAQLFRSRREVPANPQEVYGPPPNAERSPRQFGGAEGNTYFPVTFNGYGASANARQGGGGGFYGSSTAIANSLATGRSGIANSHATAFGDPNAAASFFRNRAYQQ